MDYRLWALLSAVFAGITAILAKKGVEGIPSDLALAVRVLVVAIAAWALVIFRREMQPITSQGYLFLTLSGLATGASWLCYFRALQKGEVSRVAPIDKLSFVLAMILGAVILKERPSVNVWCGAALIVAGVLLTLK